MTKKLDIRLIFTLMALFVSLSAPGAHADKPAWGGSHHTNMSTTARNERIVVQFYDRVFNQRHDVAKLAKKYLTKDYIQHNPFVPTGRQGFIDAIGGFLPYVPLSTKYEIKRVIASGDLVVLHVHVHTPGDGNPGTALIDIFRVNNDGKISEHWDVAQQIPDSMPHDNGMF